MSRYASRRISVGTTAVAIGTAAAQTTRVLTLANHAGGEIVIGDSDVSWANGFRLKTGGTPWDFTITDGDILFAIVNTGTRDLDIYDFTVDL
jgi:hypothetical protein